MPLGEGFVKGRKPTPKDTHPNNKSLREHFPELFAKCHPSFLSIKQEACGKSLGKLLAQIVFSCFLCDVCVFLGWVAFRCIWGQVEVGGEGWLAYGR